MANEQEQSDDFIRKTLNQYIEEKFLLEDNSTTLDDDESFMEKGVIDSTGILELVNFIEESFKITVEDEELIPDNLDSLNNLIVYIRKKLEHAS
jgi:acyl carrier protein